ncbi:MBL fold metallo-hydrolase [Methylomonas methanica]|uniref:Beta-lactamase-like protein n=1 Tax=Methylomonas methanica (strain DSM 25384 / MC09) TaxID=857087 RepID=G0A1K2_METMM|nr:MBL fold metallo-hydrolase [Methylomonas methanica]AEG00063.1 beta-lactamase-like protein [Methylomonas methanica MC09]
MKTNCYWLHKQAAALLCGMLIGGSTVAESKTLMLQVLGSGGPELSDKRASTSYLLSLGGKARLLLDTGPGSSLHFEASGADFNDIDAVLFSHFHVDHSADLPAYIKAGYFSGRDRDLRVYGPVGNILMPSTHEFVQGLFGERGVYRYLNEYLAPGTKAAYKLKPIDIKPQADQAYQIKLSPDITLRAVSVPHGPIPALAWRIESGGCALTFSGDTNLPGPGLTDLARGSDLLIAHHAVPEHAGPAALSLHMPPSAIGKLAAEAGVKRLLLSHRMLRTAQSEAETLRKIREHYAGPVEFAEDMTRYQPCP